MAKITPYDGTDLLRRIVAHEDAARAAETQRLASPGAIGCLGRAVQAKAVKSHVVVRDVHPIQRDADTRQRVNARDTVTPGFLALASAQAKIDGSTEAQAVAYGYRADDRRVNGDLAKSRMRVKPSSRERGLNFADGLTFERQPSYVDDLASRRKAMKRARKAAKAK